MKRKITATIVTFALLISSTFLYAEGASTGFQKIRMQQVVENANVLYLWTSGNWSVPAGSCNGVPQRIAVITGGEGFEEVYSSALAAAHSGLPVQLHGTCNSPEGYLRIKWLRTKY